MNRPVKKAIQNMTVLKPRPSWNRRATGTPLARSCCGTRKVAPASRRRCGSMRRTRVRRSFSFWRDTRNDSDSGIVFRMNGIRSTGTPAAKNTICQPNPAMNCLPITAARMPPMA
ncbi:hypothetical protein D9M68_470030 [compost metagenome]